jgi:hypothetical protein
VGSFLKEPGISTYDYGVSSRHTNGFTSPAWRHVVVRTNNPKNLTPKTADIIDSIRNTMTSAIEKTGMYSGKPWSFSAGADTAYARLVTWAHEIGHQLHYRVRDRVGPAPSVESPTFYGDTNRKEWHAEGFAAWLFNRDALAAYNADMADYFDRLVADVAGGEGDVAGL